MHEFQNVQKASPNYTNTSSVVFEQQSESTDRTCKIATVAFYLEAAMFKLFCFHYDEKNAGVFIFKVVAMP